MRRLILLTLALLCGPVSAQQPFLGSEHWSALRDEASGAAAYENLRSLTRLHRVPATAEFDEAAALIHRRAEQYGLSEVHDEHFPIDGKIQYGLLRSYYGWQVEEGSLWEISPQRTLLGDWANEPIRLADFSNSADVEASLVDVGAGTDEADYSGKDVRGRIVLADGNLGTVQRLAVIGHGAAGIVSDMPNQTTAWSGLDQTLVRWGHLDGNLRQGFAFMVSRAAAEELRAQLASGRAVMLSARVKAETKPGQWVVVSGIIPGSDPAAGEVVFSCHLDHQRPGANDNGSGCVTILEAARMLSGLIARGALPRPARTLRFIWGPEIDGTVAYLNSHPELRRAMRADVHMDMVGGDLFKNKSVLHVTETPWSLPSFITDIGEVFAETIRLAAARYAEEGADPDAAELEQRLGALGSRNEFFVDRTAFTEGSDEDDYQAFGIPSLYLRDWPDVYIHTDHDSLEQIDPTKLRRVALLGAATGYSLAALDRNQSPALLPFFAARAQQRLAKSFERAETMLRDGGLTPMERWYEARNIVIQSLRRERATLTSLSGYVGGADLGDFGRTLDDQAAALLVWLDRLAAQGGKPVAPWLNQPDAGRIPSRIAVPGRLLYQNDDVLLDRLGPERLKRIVLLNGAQGRLFHVGEKSALYAYEITNLVDGKRTLAEIRDIVAAEVGPIPLAVVADYVKALEEAKIVALR